MMRSCSRRWRMPRRATAPLTFRRSLMIDGVISFAFGISLRSLSSVGLSKRTRLLSFSFILPFDHFFFLPLPPAMAAFILASLVFCWTFGGMLAEVCAAATAAWGYGGER